MFLFNVFLILHSVNSIFGYPTDEYYGYRKLTPEESNDLKKWNESSKQNIWELSGQFEGDIILTTEQRNGKENLLYRWPKNELPYKLSDDFTAFQKIAILRAIKKISKATCVKFRPATADDYDYVDVTAYEGGCYSRVGRVGGIQQLNLQPDKVREGCLRQGTIIHEFLHALGFHHMQSDSARDDYVTIQFENILPGKEGNFKKYPASEVTSFEEPYDYGSIMHYSAYAFSINKDDPKFRTIVPCVEPYEDESIGQRDQLSKIDINKINKMYECP